VNKLSVTGLKIDFPEYQISADHFQVSGGEFFSIEAPSGFGKTTLLRALMGFQKINAGSIELNSHAIEKLPPHARNLGVVFQDHLLFPNLTAWENAAFGLRLRKKLDLGARLLVDQAFQDLNLSDRMHASITELSGGERQRVALLRATLFEPHALILDEPLKGLDPSAILQAVAYLKKWVEKNPVPVIWVSHQGSENFSGRRLVGTAGSKQRHFSVDR
jgi:ABC-type Fe3+/spermidine/putrescine transport system ATPase subunit